MNNTSDLTEQETKAVTEILKKLSPGFLPYEIFIEVVRLAVNPILEIVPLRIRNDEVEVLLLKRDEDDEFWPGMLHTPGTNFRANDSAGSFEGPLNRIISKELNNIKILKGPVYVYTEFHDVARGRELGLIHWIEVEGNNGVGEFYNVNNLPKSIVETQVKFIKAAIENYKKNSLKIEKLYCLNYEILYHGTIYIKVNNNMPAQIVIKPKAVLRTIIVLATVIALLGILTMNTSLFKPQKAEAVSEKVVSSSTMFLKLDGIEGESTDDKHKNEIDIQAYSFGASNSGSAHVGGGIGSGKVNFQDISFTMAVNKASPKLLMSVANGRHIKEGTLSVRKDSKSKEDYLIVKISDILVTSYQQSGNSGNTTANDSFTLTFSKFEMKYSPQEKDGSLSTPIEGGWDIKENKGL